MASFLANLDTVRKDRYMDIQAGTYGSYQKVKQADGTFILRPLSSNNTSSGDNNSTGNGFTGVDIPADNVLQLTPEQNSIRVETTTANGVIKLPCASELEVGALFNIYNSGNVIITVKTCDGNTLFKLNGGVIGSFVLLEKNPEKWLVGGAGGNEIVPGGTYEVAGIEYCATLNSQVAENVNIAYQYINQCSNDIACICGNDYPGNRAPDGLYQPIIIAPIVGTKAFVCAYYSKNSTTSYDLVFMVLYMGDDGVVKDVKVSTNNYANYAGYFPISVVAMGENATLIVLSPVVSTSRINGCLVKIGTDGLPKYSAITLLATPDKGAAQVPQAFGQNGFVLVPYKSVSLTTEEARLCIVYDNSIDIDNPSLSEAVFTSADSSSYFYSSLSAINMCDIPKELLSLLLPNAVDNGQLYVVYEKPQSTTSKCYYSFFVVGKAADGSVIGAAVYRGLVGNYNSVLHIKAASTYTKPFFVSVFFKNSVIIVANNLFLRGALSSSNGSLSFTQSKLVSLFGDNANIENVLFCEPYFYTFHIDALYVKIRKYEVFEQLDLDPQLVWEKKISPKGNEYVGGTFANLSDKACIKVVTNSTTKNIALITIDDNDDIETDVHSFTPRAESVDYKTMLCIDKVSRIGLAYKSGSAGQTSPKNISISYQMLKIK